MIADALLQADWYALEDPAAPGEHLVLESVGRKLSAVWLSRDEAQAFVGNNPGLGGMLPGRLDSLVLKQSFLTALSLLGVEQVLVGYQLGQPGAVALELRGALGQITSSLQQLPLDSGTGGM